MGKLYVGNSGSTPAIVNVKEVNKNKFGANIDTFFGNVDENGMLEAPTMNFVLDLSGVTTVASGLFKYKFYLNKNLSGVIANDIINAWADSFYYAFYGDDNCTYFYFDSIEEVRANYAFYHCFDMTNISGGPARVIRFKKLKKVSGSSAFSYAFGNTKRNLFPAIDEIFPVLEEITGTSTFSSFIYYSYAYKHTFSSVKKIQGPSSQYSATFGSTTTKNLIWNFPRAVDFSGYIWNITSSYPGEIHFAVANQAAIEACTGYENKWGYVGATIYFDLILSITVDGVVYERDGPNSIHVNGKTPYVGWTSESGNTVYTDATTEPAVGTVVYSNAGTTQVGTVEAVA